MNVFSFKAFAFALLFGLPWLFSGRWQRMLWNLVAMSALVASLLIEKDLKSLAEAPYVVMALYTGPAFFFGFIYAEKKPGNLFLKGLVVLLGGFSTWVLFFVLVALAEETGLIPELDIEVPLSGELAGEVPGHKTLSLAVAKRCKNEYDDLAVERVRLDRELAAMKPRGRELLEWQIRLDREKNAIRELKSRSLSASETRAMNARIRTYNADADRFNDQNQAYHDKQKSLIQKLTDAQSPPGEWFDRCTVKTAIHYDDFRQVCNLRDFGFISGGNFFCKRFPKHKAHMEEQIRKQRRD